MQQNVAYKCVQQKNLTSSENIYNIPNILQTGARKVEPVARHTTRKRRPCVKCSNFVAALTILLAALAVVLSVIQQIKSVNQEQKLQSCESNIQKTLNKSINELRIELLGLLENESVQLPSDTKGKRTISPSIKQAVTVTSTIELITTITPTTLPSETCGGPEWRRVAFLNMTDPNQNCPQGLSLTEYSIRSCGRGHSGKFDCSSVTFPVDGPQYSQVCGRVTAYRWGGSNAFFGYHILNQNIDGYYVTGGLSLTHGQPRTHIWTFASGRFSSSSRNSQLSQRCPCDPGNTYGSPLFVGEDYFCESVATVDNYSGNRLYPNNALWDGQDLLNPCYGLNNPPWFNKPLPEPTTDDIELRMCFNDNKKYANIAIELLEIYIQ